MATKKMVCLDGIRGIAFLLVFIMHLIAANIEWSINVAGAGKLGVWLFFVLSAFLLSLPYFENTERKITQEWYVFYIKRFFRIFPTYIFVLLMGVGLQYLTKRSFVSHLILQEGVGHFWTMPVEVKFYVLAPLIIWLCSRFRKKPFFLAVVFIVFIGVQQIFYPYTATPENSIQLGWYAPVFFMGMGTSYLYVRTKEHQKKTAFFDIAAIVVFTVIICLIPGVRYLIFHMEKSRYLMNKQIFLGLLWSIFVFSVINGKYVKTFFEKCRVLQYIGKYSYPMYLTHYIFLWYFTGQFTEYNGVIILKTIFATVFASIILRKLVEAPCIFLGNWMLKKIRE